MKQDGKEKTMNKQMDPSRQQVEIVYYTDPLCCWSWAMEPAWRKLQYEFAGHLAVRYCMGGLLPGWQNFHDTLYSISRPIQMGPVWMEAGHRSGMPVNTQVWIKDPPASSYLACIAVKSADLQSAEAGARYLRQLREAIMLEGRNIAVLSVLLDIAAKFSELYPELLNIHRFKKDIIGGMGKEAFQKDLQEVQYNSITRFPALIFRQPGQPSLITTGNQPYIVLRNTLLKLAPGLEPAQREFDTDQYTRFWKTLMPRELEEVRESVRKKHTP
jgi:putative protein-disulfide isomerase